MKEHEKRRRLEVLLLRGLMKFASILARRILPTHNCLGCTKFASTSVKKGIDISMLINRNPLKRSELSDVEFQNLMDRSDESTSFLVSYQGNPLCRDLGGGKYSHVFFTKAELPSAATSLANTELTFIYMGARDEHHYVAIEVGDPAPYLALVPDGGLIRSLRDVSEGMIDGDAVALLAHASGLATWHYRTRCCVKCGALLRSQRAGNARRCVSATCGVSSYPRIEPAVIQLVQSPCLGYALLGRKKVWPKGRYSCLAGFVEIGETLEQCVVRETLEEAGVLTHIDSVQYKRSQPWPFPSSLMLGYFATAVGAVGTLPAIHVQEEEMEDVKWVSRAELRAAIAASSGSTALDKTAHSASVVGGAGASSVPLSLPGPISLARSMLTEWAALDVDGPPAHASASMSGAASAP